MLRPFIAVVFLTYVQADFRILHGKEVNIEDFPYIASIHYEGKNIGAGTIINSRQILTAAHLKSKRFGLPLYTVRVGSSIYNESGVLHSVKIFDTHHIPTKKVCNADIGLITLNEPITFDRFTQPIDIVPEGEEPVHGDMLTALGWGFNEVLDDSLHLRMARMPCIERQICNAVWQKEMNTTSFEIENNMICAGGGRTYTFLGDSGGPLVNDKKQLVGVVSWGKASLASSGYPGIFVNLANHDMQRYVHCRLILD